ncbi:hypothetical protein BELL_1339g00010 [Botrytis elliptica]|uniref:Uncharacterized protein n=1 Tax=Botrytis elliptica TaxID=278938 RepID=A0A4Z1ILD0_9HELO|nr:hypothetical protein EAE99_009969 [Botrytis elliptica]TGO57507.1 hypothetical protein BELL_1339g00010 [Botrytis elliptica]
MNNYSPTAEIPIISPRRRRIIQAFESGTRLEFMMELYKIADEDLTGFNIAPFGHQKLPRKSCLSTMIDDRDSGDLSMLKLLMVLPDEIIKSLILNTIGSRYQLEPDFKALFPQMDHSSGIYLNTILSGRHPGRGLTGREWAVVVSKITTYVAGQGIMITGNSTNAEREAAREASSIDNAYGDRPNLDKKKFEPYRGHRYWMNHGQVTQIFCRELRNRCNQTLDPSQTTRQIQSPCEIGLSHDMQARVKNHHPDSGLRNTVKIWGLVLSCLSVANIDFTVVSIPVLKVWDRSLIGKAEILITFLAGSSFDEGGFNASQPGANRNLEIPDRLRNEEIDVFHDNETFLNNLREGEETLSQNQNILNKLKKFDIDVESHRLHDAKDNLRELKDTRREQLRLIETLNNKVENFDDSKIQDIKDATHRTERRAQFASNLDDWLNKTNPREKTGT